MGWAKFVSIVSAFRGGIFIFLPKSTSRLLGVMGCDGSGELGETGVADLSGFATVSSPDVDDEGDSNAQVAPQDEYSVHGIPYDDTDSAFECRAKIMSEDESLLHRETGSACFDFGGSELPFVSSDESLSMSIPDSQGQRAILPSKTTPSE
jgi:hypothetical protein